MGAAADAYVSTSSQSNNLQSQLVEPDIHAAVFQLFGGRKKTGGFKLLLFQQLVVVLDHQSSQTQMQRSMCFVQNHQHAFIQIIYNVSILGTVQGPQQKHEKRGKSCQTSGKKTCNNKSCRATMGCVLYLDGFCGTLQSTLFQPI